MQSIKTDILESYNGSKPHRNPGEAQRLVRMLKYRSDLKMCKKWYCSTNTGNMNTIGAIKIIQNFTVKPRFSAVFTHALTEGKAKRSWTDPDSKVHTAQ